MNARPTYPNPTNVSDKLAQVMLSSASRKWVYVDADGVSFWLNESRAKAIHAKHGGELFAPKG
jgi:hypothetical protein